MTHHWNSHSARHSFLILAIRISVTSYACKNKKICLNHTEFLIFICFSHEPLRLFRKIRKEHNYERRTNQWIENSKFWFLNTWISLLLFFFAAWVSELNWTTYVFIFDRSSAILCNKNSRSFIWENKNSDFAGGFNVINIDLCNSTLTSSWNFSTCATSRSGIISDTKPLTYKEITRNDCPFNNFRRIDEVY